MSIILVWGLTYPPWGDTLYEMSAGQGTKKLQILHRLKIARGHLDKVIKMVDEDAYCIDVLTQSQAVAAQIKEADVQILEGHLKTCVKDAMTSGDADASVLEVLKIFRRGRA